MWVFIGIIMTNLGYLFALHILGIYAQFIYAGGFLAKISHLSIIKMTSDAIVN